MDGNISGGRDGDRTDPAWRACQRQHRGHQYHHQRHGGGMR